MGASSRGTAIRGRLPRRLALAFLSALLALGVMVGLTLYAGDRDDEASLAVKETLQVQHRLFALSAHLEKAAALDLEERLFGRDIREEFALTGAGAREDLFELGQLIDEPIERARFDGLRADVEHELEVLDDPPATDEAVDTSRDLKRLEQIRSQINSLLESAKTRLEAQEAAAARTSHFADAVLIAGSLLFLVMTVLAARTARDEFQRREELGLFQERLVGIVTHDLRSPLAAILAEARLLQRQQGMVGALAGQIAKAAVRIDRLTSVIAAFAGSRSRCGLQLERSQTDLRVIVTRVIDELSAGKPGRALIVHLSGDCTGSWDRPLLSQLVTSLVDNALRHGPAGRPVEILVSGEPDEVLIEVHDEGKIPPEKVAGLFQALRQQADDGTIRFSSGLGLFVVREIARAHGGEVSVRTSSVEGTTFAVRLPRETAPERARDRLRMLRPMRQQWA